MAWQSFGQDGDKNGIFAQRFSSTSSAVGGEFQVSTTTTDQQVNPAVAGSIGAGNFEPITLGASQRLSGDGVADTLADFFTGAIDEVAIFGTALSATDVGGLYSAGLAAADIAMTPGGDDFLDAGDDRDEMYGGRGDDIVQFDPNGATVFDNDITAVETIDFVIDGAAGRDTLIGTATNDRVDLRDGMYEGPTGQLEILELGDGEDILVARRDVRIDYQTYSFGEDDTDVLSLFDLDTPRVDLSGLDVSYDKTLAEWTVKYTGLTGLQTVTLDQATIIDDDSWNPLADLADTFPDQPDFIAAQYIDGGGGANLRLEGSEGTDIIFGGLDDGITDFFGFDDFIYSGQGDDIVVGGADYDVYFFGRGFGDDIIIDGNDRDAFGFANGLVMFEGFDEDGLIDVTRPGVTSDDVTFTNNSDGTFTLAFGNGDGSVTFAGHEISEIELRDHDLAAGPAATSTVYSYNTVTDTYDFISGP